MLKNIVLFFVLAVCMMSGIAVAQRYYLYRWDEGEGTDWPGWIYTTTDVSYDNPGWYKEDGIFLYNVHYPRIFRKGDYGNISLAGIDIMDRAPCTSSGGCFRVYDTGEGTVYQPSWWMWDAETGLSVKGYADSHTNRMSVWVKAYGFEQYNGGEPVYNFEMGTYLCWGSGTHQGEGCPYEGPGNQHYYHQITINPGTWIHILFDQHPSHLRGVHETPDNDPAFSDSGMHYYETFLTFYLQFAVSVSQTGSYFKLDDISFLSTQDLGEEDQNDESITNIWVGYWPNEDYWEIGWSDCSFAGYSDNTYSTFEIRWSTQPITNENYNEANIVNPLFFAGEEYTGENSNYIRRVSAWKILAWTRFKLPDDIEQHYNHIYFAVKDVSVAGAHVGTQWPYNKGDGHDAPSPYIHTIDYHLRPDNNTYSLEDVNQDGSVNISDVQVIVNVILGNAANDRADVNGDDHVTISDVQEVVNSIL